MRKLMQQNINPENKNIHPQQTHIPRTHRLLKPKGKPFWLNLTASKNQNYQKYKTDQNQLNQVSQPFESQIIEDKTAKLQQNQYQKQLEHSFIESVQSFNQNYQEDFQSYSSTINQPLTTKPKQKPTSPYQVNPPRKNIKEKINRLQQSLIKSPQRKVNNTSLTKKSPQQFRNNKTQRVKTQQCSRSQSFNLTKQLLVHQNPMYLCKENQKMIRMIQQMRKLLPMMAKNQQEIKQQGWELETLQSKVRKATSADYEFSLQKSKSQLQLTQKAVYQRIKLLNSPKQQRKIPTLINDDYSSLLTPQQRIREQLLCKMRLHCLKEQQGIHLQKKIILYQDIIDKLSTKQKIQSYTDLQRRKIFLEWDVSRAKNQLDLRYLNETLAINQLKQEIENVDAMLHEKENLINHLQKKSQKQLLIKPTEQNPEEENVLQKKLNKNQQLPVIQSPKRQSHSYIAKRKQINSQKNPSYSNLQQKSFFSKRGQKQKEILSLHQQPNDALLPSLRQNKGSQEHSLRQKKELIMSKMNLSIRIKKSAFKNATLTQDLEELIL